MDIKNEDFKKIMELMPIGWEEKAKELKAIERSRKIATAEELLRMILLYLTSGGSFGKTSAILRLTDENSLNKNAVYERIVKSRDWLKWLCENTSRNVGELVEKPEWLKDKKVCLIDASDVSKKGSNGSDYKLHYNVELFNLEMREMHITESSVGEKFQNFKKLGTDDIVIADRAYGSLKSIKYLKEKNCGFILRLKAGAFNFYDSEGIKIELSDCFEELKEGESSDKILFYKEKEKLLSIRVCGMRKSKEMEQKGLKQIKHSNTRHMRGKVSKKQAIYNKYILLATSCDREIKSEYIVELYRMRWEIELVFKRIKSIFSYGEMPSKLEKTAESWFYGKLLLSYICESLVNKGRFSPREK